MVEKEAERRTAKHASLLPLFWGRLGRVFQICHQLPFRLKRVHTCDAEDDCSNLVIFILPSYILSPTSCRKTSFRLRTMARKVRWDVELLVLELSHYFLLHVLWLSSPLSVTWLCPKVSLKNLTLTSRFLGSTFAGGVPQFLAH